MLTLASTNEIPFTSDNPLPTPTRLGYFSCSNTHSIHYDNSSMRLLNLPEEEIKLDSVEGAEIVNQDQAGRENNDSKILSWITSYRKCIISSENGTSSDKPDLIVTDFICDSSVIELIMETPFNKSFSWTVTAVKFGGVIYLSSKEVPSLRELKESRSMREEGDPGSVQDHYFPSTDHRFKQHITKKVDGSPCISSPECAQDSFHFVNTVKLNKFHILYSAQADCASSPKQLDKPLSQMKCFIIRTHSDLPPDAKSSLALSWWISCSISSCTKIALGYLESNKISKSVIFKRPRDLVKSDCNVTPKISTKFLESMLNFVKSNVIDELKLFEFKYNDNGTKVVTFSQLNGSCVPFIPNWYTDYINSRKVELIDDKSPSK